MSPAKAKLLKGNRTPHNSRVTVGKKLTFLFGGIFNGLFLAAYGHGWIVPTVGCPAILSLFAIFFQPNALKRHFYQVQSVDREFFDFSPMFGHERIYFHAPLGIDTFINHFSEFLNL